MKIYLQCGATTHVLRLSWSPDGHFIVSAHAMNNRGPTAQIIEREGWKTSMDFVGHRKAVTVAVSFVGIVFRSCFFLEIIHDLQGAKVEVEVSVLNIVVSFHWVRIYDNLSHGAFYGSY